MRAALLLPVFASRDAIGTDVIGMMRALSARGVECRIFCEGTDAAEHRTYPASKALAFAGGGDDLVIYHFSTGWDAGLEIMKRAPGRRIVRYHNITPAEFFADYSPIHADTCARGRRELPLIAALGCERYLAASAYNARELVDAGAPAERVEVLPPFHRVEALLDEEADLATLEALADGTTNILAVGRIVPNKSHLDLVDALAAYLDRFDDAARLVLVGKTDPNLVAYEEKIRARAEAQRVAERVHWIKAASEAELKAAYLAAHVMLVMSRHEGFCVPLVEAMALDLPVVARDGTAIGETLAKSGLVWSEDDPLLYAASIDRVMRDASLRSVLEDRGRATYARHYAGAEQPRRFLEALGGAP